MFRRIQTVTTQKPRSKRGFTLLEIMVSMALFTIVALSATITLFHAMRFLARARYRDRAANILQTVAEQFQSSKTRERLDVAHGQRVADIKPFFQVTGDSTSDVFTGTGMAWNVQTQTFMYDYTGSVPASWTEGVDFIRGTADGLSFKLITAGNTSATDAPELKLTRRVRYVDPSSGGVVDTPVNDDYSGYLIQATFNIEYAYLNQTIRLSTTVLRNINPTDK